ncbi:MAG: hypothetical protein LBM05_00645 [Endomicrobium sp.]|jgi:hypothetical protein|nr:hypothetical protein [Endomicrobium sp.]
MNTKLQESQIAFFTGMTAGLSISDLNKLYGSTFTKSDLDMLHSYVATGVTATEFDYLDGVTSNIQTQIDALPTVSEMNTAISTALSSYVAKTSILTSSTSTVGDTTIFSSSATNSLITSKISTALSTLLPSGANYLIETTGTAGTATKRAIVTTITSSSSDSAKIPTVGAVLGAIDSALSGQGDYEGTFDYYGTYAQVIALNTTTATGLAVGNTALVLGTGTPSTQVAGHVYKGTCTAATTTSSTWTWVEVDGGAENGDYANIRNILANSLGSGLYASGMIYYKLESGQAVSTATFDVIAGLVLVPDNVTLEVVGATKQIRIKAGGVSADQLASNAVTTAKILNNNVTLAKIEQVAAYTLLANNTNATANLTELSFDTFAGAMKSVSTNPLQAKIEAAAATTWLLSGTTTAGSVSVATYQVVSASTTSANKIYDAVTVNSLISSFLKYAATTTTANKLVVSTTTAGSVNYYAPSGTTGGYLKISSTGVVSNVTSLPVSDLDTTVMTALSGNSAETNKYVSSASFSGGTLTLSKTTLPVSSVTVSGTGNAVTNASFSNGALTLTKGNITGFAKYVTKITTAATSIANAAFSAGVFMVFFNGQLLTETTTSLTGQDYTYTTSTGTITFSDTLPVGSIVTVIYNV